MSNPGILARARASVAAVIRTPLWVSLVAAEGILALVATALTVLSRETNVDGLDSGRMALSFTVLLVLAFALFTTPAIVDRVRNTTGGSGFVDSFFTSAIVGASLVLAAAPAVLWAILATGINPAIWMSALSALKLEVFIVVVLVSVAFWTIRSTSIATTISYAAIVSLVVGPFMVLGVTSVLPGTSQKTEYWTLDWDKVGTDDTDPVTGYPLDPKCPSKNTTTENVPRYDLVWAVAPVVPFALVSEAVEPELAEFINTMYMDESQPIDPDTPKSTAAIDLFTSITLITREMQITPEETIVINECELLEETGQPYAPYPYGPDARDILETTQSGFVPGLVGQSAIAGAWLVGMLVTARLRRQK